MGIIREIITESRARYWSDGFQWLGWSIICGLMPILILLLALILFKQTILIGHFTNNGEFALYSASFLSTAFYIVLRDFRKRAFPSRPFLSLIMVPLLLLSGCLYSFVALINVLNSATAINTKISSEFLQIINDLFDRGLIRNITLVILPIVLILTLIIVVADNIQSEADIRDIQSKKYKAFEKDFDELGRE